MNSIPTPDQASLPSLPQLVRAVGVAATIATLALLVAVLPAEYGIDPTGIGARVGLLRPLRSTIDKAAPISAEAAATVTESATTFRSDELTLTLKPGEGAEIKATMRRGDSYSFSWTAAGGTVEFDMHGEHTDGSGSQASYRRGEDASSGYGTFRAPFDGRHGWFWRNLTWEPITVTLKTSGFYSKIEKL